MAAFNLTSAVIYAARVPGKVRPITYDIYGSSHQVLHVAVALSALAHIFDLFRAFDYPHTKGFGLCKGIHWIYPSIYGYRLLT